MADSLQGVAARLRVLRQVLGEFTYGLTGYEFVHHALRMRSEMESLFILVTLGDLIGLPILPPYYSLRILPYVVPQVATWKHKLVEEKELWEREEYDLHGI